MKAPQARSMAELEGAILPAISARLGVDYVLAGLAQQERDFERLRGLQPAQEPLALVACSHLVEAAISQQRALQ